MKNNEDILWSIFAVGLLFILCVRYLYARKKGKVAYFGYIRIDHETDEGAKFIFDSFIFIVLLFDIFMILQLIYKGVLAIV